MTFDSREVCQIAGITARQLQWWDERGLIRPGRQGHRRAFRPDDVIAMLVIGELRRKGLSLQRIRRLLRRLRQEIGQRQNDLQSGGPDWYLLTHGEALYLESSPEGVVERLKKHREPMWLVSLSEQAARLRAFERRAARSRPPGRHRRPPESQLSLFR